MPDKITSMTNPRIRRLVELRKKAKLRRETGLFIIEGTRLCMDTPERFLEEVYVTEDWLRTAAPADAEKIQRFHPLILAEEVMAKAADTDTPQGILCAARMPVWTRQDLLGGSDGTPAPLLLVLEDVRDPGNLGTIFRTAEAAGATGILMSRGTVDLFNPKVVRATMSAIFRMPFVISEDLIRDLGDLRERGIVSYAAHLRGKRPYDELPLTQGTAFLIGNEANGLSDSLTEAAAEKIIIPLAGGAESLNAAMAAGILLFEASRQRRVLTPQFRA
ncbi:MAG: RNA methyltransferase [Lachnospiraceae bacterium]|nr:RNA methyltransferase [Lachnospiraceae bacterium]